MSQGKLVKLTMTTIQIVSVCIGIGFVYVIISVFLDDLLSGELYKQLFNGAMYVGKVCVFLCLLSIMWLYDTIRMMCRPVTDEQGRLTRVLNSS